MKYNAINKSRYSTENVKIQYRGFWKYTQGVYVVVLNSMAENIEK